MQIYACIFAVFTKNTCKTSITSPRPRFTDAYTCTHDCYRAVNNEALRAISYVNNPNSYTSTRFRVTFYYSNGTTVVRGASLPRAQCYTYLATNDYRGVLVLVKVEG